MAPVPSQDRHRGGARFLVRGALQEPRPEWRDDLVLAEPGPAAVARLQWRVTQAVDAVLALDPAAKDRLAAACRCDMSTIDARLRGSQTLEPRHLRAFAETLGLVVTDLLHGDLSNDLDGEWFLRPAGDMAPPRVTDWSDVCMDLGGNFPSDPDAVALVDDATLGFLVATSLGRAGAPASRVRWDQEPRLGRHLVVEHGSASSVVLPLSLGSHETATTDRATHLSRAYARLLALGDARTDETVAVLLAGRRMLDQARGWDPPLHRVLPGRSTSLAPDEARRLDILPGRQPALRLHVVAVVELPDGAHAIVCRPSQP